MSELTRKFIKSKKIKLRWSLFAVKVPRVISGVSHEEIHMHVNTSHLMSHCEKIIQCIQFMQSGDLTNDNKRAFQFYHWQGNFYVLQQNVHKKFFAFSRRKHLVSRSQKTKAKSREQNDTQAVGMDHPTWKNKRAMNRRVQNIGADFFKRFLHDGFVNSPKICSRLSALCKTHFKFFFKWFCDDSER